MSHIPYFILKETPLLSREYYKIKQRLIVRQVDVVVGNDIKGFWQYGLEFESSSWKLRPNGDGAAIKAYAFPYSPEHGEVLTYYAQVGNGRRGLKGLGTLGKQLSRKITVNIQDTNKTV